MKSEKMENLLCLLEFKCAKKLKVHSQAIPAFRTSNLSDSPFLDPASWTGPEWVVPHASASGTCAHAARKVGIGTAPNVETLGHWQSPIPRWKAWSLRRAPWAGRPDWMHWVEGHAGWGHWYGGDAVPSLPWTCCGYGRPQRALRLAKALHVPNLD